MTVEEYLAALKKDGHIQADSPMHQVMHQQARKAQEITAKINTGYHDPEELRALFSELIGKKVDEGFRLFPPFYTDFGRNIAFGKNVPTLAAKSKGSCPECR